jgi:hypothetical protein
LPNITTYYYYNSDPILFNTAGIVVTATIPTVQKGYPNRESSVWQDSGSLGFSVCCHYVCWCNKDSYYNLPVTLVKGVSQVGATDFSSGWWTAFSADYTVASGSSKTFTMYCYSDNLANWHSPCTILRKADKMNML